MVYTGNFTPPSGSKVRLNRMDYLPVINATAVSKEYKPQFGFAGGQVIKVVFDVAREGYVDVEQELAAGLARS